MMLKNVKNMITPLEIKEKRFPAGWMGFQKDEVLDYLDLISTEFQVVLKENRELRRQLEDEKEKQQQLLKREALINNVLLTAQEGAEKMRQNAAHEAELMLKEAELRVEKILNEANKEKDRIGAQIEELRVLYKQFKAKMRSILVMHSQLLEDEDVQEQG